VSVRPLFLFLSFCLFVPAASSGFAAPFFAPAFCSLPPMDTNPYSRQAGIGSDNPYALWSRDSHTYNPYSSTAGSRREHLPRAKAGH
jgi:hypothetical protein